MSEYWELTIGQFRRAIEGYRKRMSEEAKQTDALNHVLGSYIAKAFHQPNKYPKKAALAEDKKLVQRRMSDDEMNLIGRLIARKK